MPQDAGLPDPSSDLSPLNRSGPSPVAGRIDPAPPPRSPGAPPGLSAAPDVGALLQGLRRRWISATILGTVLATVVSVGFWFLLTPKATAFSTLQIRYLEPNVLRSGPSGGPADFKAIQATTAAQIQSGRVINAALKRDEVRRLSLESRETDPAAYIRKNLKVESKETNELLTIVFTDPDPQVALAIAEAIKEAFMDDIVHETKLARVRAVTKLEKVYGEAVEGLKVKRSTLKKIAENLGATEPTQWILMRSELLSNLRELKQVHSQVSFKRIENTAALEAFDLRAKMTKDVKGPEPANFEALVDAEMLRDEDARDHRQQIKRYKATVKDFVDKGFGRELLCERASQNLKKAEKDLRERRLEVAAEVKKGGPRLTSPPTRDDSPYVRAQLAKNVESLTKLEGDLKGDIDRLGKEVTNMPQVGQEYVALADEVQLAQKSIDNVGTQLERERIELDAASRISRYQNAELVESDNKKQILAAGASPLAVLLAVCMGLAYLDYRQRRIRTAGQVSRGLGIRVVGAVPDAPNLEHQIVGPSGEPVLEGHPVLESIDALRAVLLHEAHMRSTRIVMVTSATAGEGKTTLASHLACSLARAGRKTLLLDGDLRRPTVHELFELPMQPGFSEVLLGEIEVTEACQETNLETLSIIPAGQWDREVLQALARDGLEGMFDKLQQEFDFIIIDSHPVLPASDSLILGRQVDAVILSVLREVSQMPKVYAAAQKLSSLGIRVLGAVVNGTDPEDVFSSPSASPAVAV